MMLDENALGSIPACAGEPRCQARASDTTGHGSIPACAGEPRSARCVVSVPLGSIPACAGEPRQGSRKLATARGLSPRVRGSRDLCCPAMDGQSINRVYPRVCGGAVNRRGPGGSDGGLSPRVRGSLAGAAATALILLRVYPRVCGGAGGNPCEKGRRAQGSIPACAGEPVTATCPHNPETGLSPRVRGSHRHAASTAHEFREGLSPRVRGSRPQLIRPLPPHQGLSPRVRGSLRL